ncbi:MAG: FeoB-associated Cys-rich membrane protein [Acholeplasmataceae bacterium]|jgi:hypothetical protein
MTTADIIILIVVLLIVGLIVFRLIYNRIKKNYCSSCYSKTSCSLKAEDLLKEIDSNIKK